MKPGRFFWKLFLGNVALLTLALVVSVALILREFDRFYLEDVKGLLKASASALAEEYGTWIESEQAPELDRIAEEFGSGGPDGLRITFIAADGTVLGDSDGDPARMESHHDRPEIQEALRGGWGEITRWSQTVARDMKYVARRVGSKEEPVGVVRTSLPLRAVGLRGHAVRRLAWSIVLTAAAAAALLAMGLARLWSRPIARITAAARTLSRGDLSTRLRISGSDETAVLSRSLDTMRRRLAQQLATIDRQRRTLESMVSQLKEGVVVADSESRILLVNPEAQRLLQLTAPPEGASFAGLPIEQCVPQPKLQEMLRPQRGESEDDVGSVPSSPGEEPAMGAARSVQELRLQVDRSNGGVSVLARAVDILLPPQGTEEQDGDDRARTGRLLMLTDVSELTRAIQMKADFAANASHELRTPLAAIQASIETLQSMNLPEDKGPTGHFLDVIGRHAGRMQAMVADLLSLSRLESPSERFEPRELQTQEFLEGICEGFSDLTDGKRLTVSVDVAPGGQRMCVNAQLLGLALTNLLDNAIRFTDAGGSIRLSAKDQDGAVAIEVADNGCGIPLEEQARVFERFYQVQRARSGPQRGTGLGLSIVRHAVAAMGGTVELKSAPGEGTQVTVTIPRRG
jgi:two-component system phosphate regulon sensor histidine kinase PhoR